MTYCQIPTRERLRLAHRIVSSELSKYVSKSAALSPGRVLKKYLPETAPHDAAVFISDLLQIRYFHAQNNGRIYTWKLTKVERRVAKHICKLYFRRLKNFVHSNLP